MAEYTQIPPFYDPQTCSLSENFSCDEIVNASSGISTVIIDQRVINVAQYLREVLKVSISISSAVRSTFHNIEVGGSSNSQHLEENATALDVKGVGVVDFLATAYASKNHHWTKLVQLGLKGLGLYDDHSHIDTRSGNFAFWDKRSKKTFNQNTTTPKTKQLLVPVALTLATIFLAYTLIKTSAKPSY